MAKYFGKVGFAESQETRLGVWVENITEYEYYGDVHKNYRRLQSTDKVNDDITMSNEISIVADPYANQNFHKIRYITFMEQKWKVSAVDASQYPRLILSLGGLYIDDE